MRGDVFFKNRCIAGANRQFCDDPLPISALFFKGYFSVVRVSALIATKGGEGVGGGHFLTNGIPGFGVLWRA